MNLAAERIASGWDFALPSAQRPRALWARCQHALKRFLIGTPEDALVTAAIADRTGTHVAVFALLTLPLCFASLPGGAIGRWASLFSLLTGLLVAVRLESAEYRRTNPLVVLGAGVLYAIVLSGIAWELLGPSALRIEPGHALAAVVGGLAALATRSDPRLCALGGGVGVLSIGGLLTLDARSFGDAAATLITASGAGVASTIAAARGQRLQRLAVLDDASGALNAGAFERCLRSAQQRARVALQPVTVAKIEFSALREIREVHGQALASALMRWLASVLTDRFRATDLLGRTGDDEFSLALLDADHPGVERRLERVREELDTIELSRGGLREPIALRVSFGLASLPREAFDGASALQLAGRRLAHARWSARQAQWGSRAEEARVAAL